MIDYIENFPKHIQDSLKNLKETDLKLEEISKVVIAGMGGSAIAGLILKDLFPEMEIVVGRNYFPNTTIDEYTLVIVCSYSGNTEETLSYYDYAVRLTEHAIVLTTGGELLKKAKSDNIEFYLLPEGYPPRSALGFSLTFLISLFDREGISNVDFDCLESFSKESSTKKSEVYALAKKIHKTMPIIVTEEDLSSIGFRLKSQLNENSKMLSYNITIPEMNHNEIIGWENNNIDKKSFSMIWIHIGWPKNIERMKITNEILSKKVSHVVHLSVPDKVPKNLTSLFFLINYIDWLSYWCGILNDVDINAHGTSTYFNDMLETKAIKKVFGNDAENVSISSTKSMTGHLLGAAGAIEAITCINTLNNGIIPPTINYINPDPECDLDYTPNEAFKKDINISMSNSFGFGGHNSVVIFKKFSS